MASFFIPALGSAIICPVSALTRMLHTQTSPDDPLFQVPTRLHSQILWLGNILSKSPSCLILQKFLHFMILGELELLGPSGVVFLSKTSSRKVPGLLPMFGSTFRSPFTVFCCFLYLSEIPGCVMLNTPTPTWHLGQFLPSLILVYCNIKHTYHTQPCTVYLYIHGEGILSYFHLTSKLVTSGLLDLSFVWPYLLAP